MNSSICGAGHIAKLHDPYITKIPVTKGGRDPLKYMSVHIPAEADKLLCCLYKAHFALIELTPCVFPGKRELCFRSRGQLVHGIG